MRAIKSTHLKYGRIGVLRAGPKSAAGAGRLAAPWVVALLLAGCGSITDYLPGFLTPYRPDVQQGNVITSDMVDQLRPGMTRDQVKFMLGTPLLADRFHPDRWDYLYYLNPRSGAEQRRNLVIYFKDNRLEHFNSDPMPPESMADNLILGQKLGIKPTPPPKQPAKPMEPAKPTEPAAPTEPTTPAEPATPKEPAAPTEPATRTEPATPKEPATQPTPAPQ
jgi:outer membrane protein assembly factor BamE